MKRVVSFLLAVLLCFLTGCEQTNTQETKKTESAGKSSGESSGKSSGENTDAWTANSLNMGSGSLEQENYVLQHLAYLEEDECLEVLSSRADLVGLASQAYEESKQAKVNKLWTTLSDVCMLVGENELELTNEYDVLLTDLMQSSASAENFQESYEEAYCAAMKELLSGISGVLKDEKDAFKLLGGSAIDKVEGFTKSIDHWLYVFQEAEGKDKEDILILYDSALKELKEGYDEALGGEDGVLPKIKGVMNLVCDIADLISDSFSDMVDEYLFYRAASEASEEWYTAWKQIAEQVRKDSSDEARCVYESISSILSEIEKGKNEGWEQVYANSARRSASENLMEYCVKTSLSAFKEFTSKWEFGKEAQLIFSSFSTGVSMANRLMNCDDIAYYGQMVLGTGILARNTFPILLRSVNELSGKQDYESALYFDQIFHIYKDLQLKGCDFAIAFHQAIIENPVGYTLKYISDDHVAVNFQILAVKADWMGYECHGKITDYYQFIHETLLPDLGYVNTDEKRTQISVNDYFSQPGSYRCWDERVGLFAADIADLNGDEIDDLIVYYFDRKESPDSLMAQIYSRKDNGEIYLISTQSLGSTSACEDYHYYAGLVQIEEDGLYLFTAERITGRFIDYGNNAFSVYQLTEDGQWIKKYSMGQSAGGTSEVSYSIWTYVDEDTYEETVLWADGAYRAYNRNVHILTEQGTSLADALAYGLDILGVPKAAWSQALGASAQDADSYFSRTLSYDVTAEGGGIYTITSTLTDNTRFRENMKLYDDMESYE